MRMTVNGVEGLLPILRKCFSILIGWLTEIRIHVSGKDLPKQTANH